MKMKPNKFFRHMQFNFFVNLTCAVILLCGCSGAVDASDSGLPDEADTFLPRSIVVPSEYMTLEDDDITDWVKVLSNYHFDDDTYTLWFHPSRGCTDLCCVADEHYHYCPRRCIDPTHYHT